MHLARLEVRDFRNYVHAEVLLDPGVTTFVGANGQGKTNLVEAVGYLATHGSHRCATDAPLVRQGATSAIIRGDAVNEARRVRVELEINPGRANRAKVNGASAVRSRDALGVVRRVLFAPEDLALVKGDPALRRAFLDELLVSLSPRFAAVRADLDRVLRQRNSLLKSAGAVRSGGVAARRAATATLSVWDDQFAALASELIVARLELLTSLAPPAAANYCAVAPGASPDDVALEYVSSIPDLGPGLAPGEVATALLEQLAKRCEEEFARGLTLSGPHRDDLAISIRGLPVRGYASHGESWSMALALRLASFDVAADQWQSGGLPILVLDDVFAELDAGRRERLAQLVGRAEQVLVTAAVPEDVPASLGGRVLTVDAGQVGGGGRD